MLYNKAPIIMMWQSKMPKTTALSTSEAEYYAVCTAVRIAVHMVEQKVRLL